MRTQHMKINTVISKILIAMFLLASAFDTQYELQSNTVTKRAKSKRRAKGRGIWGRKWRRERGGIEISKSSSRSKKPRSRRSSKKPQRESISSGSTTASSSVSAAPARNLDPTTNSIIDLINKLTLDDKRQLLHEIFKTVWNISDEEFTEILNIVKPKNHYKVLGLSIYASQQEIENAFYDSQNKMYDFLFDAFKKVLKTLNQKDHSKVLGVVVDMNTSEKEINEAFSEVADQLPYNEAFWKALDDEDTNEAFWQALDAEDRTGQVVSDQYPLKTLLLGDEDTTAALWRKRQKEVNAAYEVLMNEKQRAQYDIELYKKLSDYEENKAKTLENKAKMLLRNTFSLWKKNAEEMKEKRKKGIIKNQK